MNRLGRSGQHPKGRLGQGRGDCREEAVRAIIDRRQITPHFQPIVDLHHGTVLGWEVLSRGPASFPSAARSSAKRARLACCHALRESAATSHCARLRGSIVVAITCVLHQRQPECDRRPAPDQWTHASRVRELGARSANFVVEITERASSEDYDAFERQIRYYLEQGFKIALDDLGTGHAGLSP